MQAQNAPRRVPTPLTGYNACFYCAGVSSLEISLTEYEPIKPVLEVRDIVALAHGKVAA